MAKTIIFCADGTWNGPEDATGASVIDSADIHGELLTSSVTNVVKLYANLAGTPTPDTIRLTDEQEKRKVDAAGATLQIAKYLHGVGDSNNVAIKLLGGVFGAGLIARIVRGYTFISRNYLDGDAIHIVGFSRGAYSARALAGMISRVGLINPNAYDLTDKATAYRIGTSAWCKSHSIALNAAPFEGLRSMFGRLVDYVETWVGSSLSPNSLIVNVPINSVAVWDTVGSMGIPRYVDDKRIDAFRFVDLALNPKVMFGFHAMAIDEMRADFRVTQWAPREGITERWFTGAHADVGGGYPPAEIGLSDIALAWLTAQLSNVSVDFAAEAYLPKTDQFMQTIHSPWTKAPFVDLGKAARTVAAGDTLAASAVDRLNKDTSYRPDALKNWLQAHPLTPTN